MPVVGKNIEVSFVPKDEAEALKSGQGIVSTLRAHVGRAKAGGTAKLKVKEAKYIGMKQAAWSDETYYAIPYEGELNAISESNLSEMTGPYCHTSVAGIDKVNKIVYYRSVYMIGD